MSIASNLDKLKLINSEIKNEQTGTPDDFAKKLNISRSMFYNYIGEHISDWIGFNNAKSMEEIMQSIPQNYRTATNDKQKRMFTKLKVNTNHPVARRSL